MKVTFYAREISIFYVSSNMIYIILSYQSNIYRSFPLSYFYEYHIEHLSGSISPRGSITFSY